MNKEMYHTCLCGCGSLPKLGNKYISGHQSRKKEVREKIRKTLTGRKHSKERIENMRKARIGKKNPKNSEALKKRWQDPEFREIQKRIRTGKKQSEETKKKRVESRKNNGKPWHSKGTKGKIGESRKGNKNPTKKPEVREKIKKTLTGRKNPKHSKFMKEKWQDTKYGEKQVKLIIKGSKIKPNRIEKKIDKILQELFPNEYLLNVEGYIIIGGKCPDFINIKGQKKIIEFNGTFWHSKEITGKPIKQHEKERINHFAKYGHKTLILHELDLEDLEKLKEKILQFHNE